MSILVLLTVRAQPGKTENVRATFADLLPATRAFDGNLGVSLHVAQDDPEEVVIVERWTSGEHYAAYVAWRTEEGDTRLGAFLAAPPAVRIFEDREA